ncbi:MFS transporter [Patescibacteria group bacterium]|nr:MFS transporter [Patescibacteria group bacterium]MCG2702159.1 MFS transporter [Candidatus Parcubacteria bacterium]MBU4264808.1 MFS transporter [Patescibacteria group bacterium]MBU4390146.1 MFS transporter [Patescibacteria group bacterium]MBU4396779.1 MFS transporter [Patescibacteria group bacterium]
MFKNIKKRFRLEIKHCLTLSVDVRRLLASYYLYVMAYPLFMLFTNAYLWQQGGDLMQLVIYNLLFCFGLPLGFYVNGLLLRHFHTLKLYALGGVLEALSAVLVVMFPSGTISSLILYGLIAGFGGGLYWANKNYLSLKLTRESNRLYYNSLESVGDMIINMIVPALAGLFIVFGEHTSWYIPTTAYKLLMFLALILVILAGYVVQSSQIKDLDCQALFVKKHLGSWSLVRLYNILSNVLVGVGFVIPSVLVLVLVGKEDALGIVNSVTAALSALCLYILGRIGKTDNNWKVVGVASIVYLFGALLLALFYNPVSVLVYITTSTIGWTFSWSPSYTVIMEAIDRENSDTGQYAYICDNELTFNIGRSIGLCLIVVALSVGQTTALRFVPLITGLIFLSALFPLVKLSNKLFKKV